MRALVAPVAAAYGRRVEIIDFLVDKADLGRTTLARVPAAALQAGEARLRIDRFGFSANNVTYALLGDMLGYWKFFPAPAPWGRIPVWGFADVIESHADAAPVGTRLFGYLPMATHFVLQPAARGGAIVDASAHRQTLPPVYNRYASVPARARDDEAAEMLLRPLFIAAFLVDDWLAEHDFFGARAVVLASASSKTAIALAHLLSRRRRCAVIGLTSPSNREFVSGLGSYDRVLGYDEIDEIAALDGAGGAVLIDLAGDARIRRAVHERLGAQLAHSCIVGNTHGTSRGDDEPLPGPPPTPFFGPAQLEKRNRELGVAAVQERLGQAWNEFLVPVRGWLRTTEHRGVTAVAQAYATLLHNRARPDEGHILSLHD
jgi:NADPH:quinone reductase-like Zn-dependent oxidoreductase